MSRYFIYLAYQGTRYNGWQRQPNGVGIQQLIEETLSTLLRCKTTVVGAGRTDTGVHARMTAAHFDAPQAIDDTQALADKLNRMLPKDIAIHRITPVADDAHARFSAVSRTYEYAVTDKKDPFNYPFVCRMILRNINFDAMNDAGQTLYAYTDFTSFSKLHTDVKTNNCRISEAVWRRNGDVWIFTIRADRFLRNMVRAIVGTLFEVGRGKITVERFRRIIEAKDRNAAGTSAPPEGLALAAIEYPREIFIQETF